MCEIFLKHFIGIHILIGYTALSLLLYFLFLVFNVCVFDCFFTGDNKPKNYLQLAGRCLLAFMFITLIRFEFTVLQVSLTLN